MPSWDCPICREEGFEKLTVFTSRTLAGLGLQRSNHLRSHGISTRDMPLSMKSDDKHLIALYLANKSFHETLKKKENKEK